MTNRKPSADANGFPADEPTVHKLGGDGLVGDEPASTCSNHGSAIDYQRLVRPGLYCCTKCRKGHEMNSSHPNDAERGESNTAMKALTLAGSIGDIDFNIQVGDIEVLTIIQRFERPAEGVHTLLRVGASACHAASVGLDLSAVRLEINSAVSQTREAVSELSKEVLSVADKEGPLAATLSDAAGQLVSQIREAVAAQGDADSPGTLLAKVHGATKTFEEGLEKVRTKIAEDLTGAVEKHSHAVSNAVREMRDLDPNSAIGGAFGRVESQLKDLGERIVAAQAANGERLRSAAKGGDFEDEVAAVTAGIAAVYGDRAERTGAQPGKVILNSRPSKRGDITCFDGDRATVVIEAMDRGPEQLKFRLVESELEEAMRNRDADTAIAVVASGDNSLMCHQPIQVLGPKTWAVIYDKEERSQLALQIAYRLAREVAKAPRSEQTEFDLERTRCAVEEVSRCLGLLGDVKSQLGNIRTCHDKASDALFKYERQVQDAVARLLMSLSPEPLADAA